MALTIRPIEPDEFGAFRATEGYAFHFDEGDGDAEHRLPFFEFDRSRCAFDGDALVGTSGAYGLDLTVPGGTLATAGTSYVAVRPTHRRRGALRAMMHAHLADTRDRGEPLAALWASESSIYRRFGYGIAGYACRHEIAREHTAFASPPENAAKLRLVTAEEVGELLPPLYDRIRLQRPGQFARSAEWWSRRLLRDPAHWRSGATKLRHVVYEAGGEVRGWARYRSRGGAPGEAPATLFAVEVQALDDAVRAALYHFLLHVDLIGSIRFWNEPIDGPLRWLLADPRQLATSVADSIWVRPVDIEAALSGRRYPAEGSIALGVRDEFLPDNDGTYVLEAGPDGAACRRRSGVEPDLRLGVAELGAVYLGGNRLQSLARAGLVEGAADALRRADALFTWDPQPWCPEIF